MIRVMVIEEQDLHLEGLVCMLKDVPGIDIISALTDADKGLQVARKIKPDVVLLDLKMSAVAGLETIKRLVRITGDTKVIILSTMRSHPFPFRTLQAGAMGFVTKDSTSEDVIQAIRKVQTGNKYLSVEIAQQLALKSVSDTPEDASPFDLLSARELQVMMMITTGLKVQDISEKLCLSPKTVNSYRYRLFDKLKIRNDVELTHLAIAHGLVDVTEQYLHKAQELAASNHAAVALENQG